MFIKKQMSPDPADNSFGGGAEPNLDLLSQAEGSMNFNDLPNLDAEMAALSAAPLEQSAENGENTDFTQKIAQENNVASQQNAEPTDVPYYKRAFDGLKQKLGDDFQIPDDVTEENYMDVLIQKIHENTDFPEASVNLHPEVAKLQKAIDSGVPYEKAFAEYSKATSFETMDDKALVKEYISNRFGKSEARPNGWDEERINAQIEKMDNSGTLELEAERMREEKLKDRELVSERLINEQKEYQATKQKEISTEREQNIAETVAKFDNYTEIYGVPVSKAEMQDFKEDFKYLVTPDNTGISPARQLLQSDENLAKVLFMLKKGDAKIREALTAAKEGAKTSFFNKLDPEPRTAKKTSTQQSDAIDLNELAAPQRY